MQEYEGVPQYECWNKGQYREKSQPQEAPLIHCIVGVLTHHYLRNFLLLTLKKMNYSINKYTHLEI